MIHQILPTWHVLFRRKTMLLWKNLEKMSKKNYVAVPTWSVPACQLVDIITEHTDNLNAAVEAAIPVVRGLNTLFAENQLHIVATSKKTGALDAELRDFAANIGLAFTA